MKAGNRRPLGYATRRTGVLGLILAMGLLTIAPAHGLEWGRSTTPGDVAVAAQGIDDPVCDLAAALTANARPQDALQVIDAYRAGSLTQRNACPVEYAKAQARTELATFLAGLSEEDFSTAMAVTGAHALSLSVREVCGADAQTNQADVVKACDQAVEPPTADTRTWSQRLGAGLTSLTTEWVPPLESVALSLLAFLAVVYLLALLGTRGFRPDSRILVGVHRSRGRWLAGTLLVLAGAAALFVHVTTSIPPDDRVMFPPLALLLAALTLGAAYGLAALMGSAFRLSVTATGADGKEKPDAVAHVIGLLNEMGADAPRGAEYPRGTDVTALKDAVFSALPTGNVAKIVVGIAGVFLPRAPWDVAIDDESADRHSVVIRRNGRSVFAAIVDRDLLGLRVPVNGRDGKPLKTPDGKDVLPDLHRATAAIVLSALRKPHGLSGLGGGTDWRSIALQAIATTDLEHTPEAAVGLLARAVHHDANNLAARLTLLRFRFRKSTTASELELYERELRDLVSRFQGVLDRGSVLRPAGASAIDEPAELSIEDARLLLQRARLNLVVALVNGAFAADAAHPDEGKLSEARQTAGLIVDSAVAAPEAVSMGIDAELRQLEASIVSNAQILSRVGLSELPFKATTALEHYQAGCHFATAPPAELSPETVRHHLSERIRHARREGLRGLRRPVLHRLRRRVVEDLQAESLRDQARTAINHFRLADSDPENAAWRTRDPQLALFRRTDAYREAFPRADADFFSLPGYEAFAETLKRLGMTDVEAMTAQDPVRLASLLRAPQPVAARMVAISQLAARVPAPLSSGRLTIASWITGKALDPTRPETADLAGAAEKRFAEEFTRPQIKVLREWIMQPGTVDTYLSLIRPVRSAWAVI